MGSRSVYLVSFKCGLFIIGLCISVFGLCVLCGVGDPNLASEVQHSILSTSGGRSEPNATRATHVSATIPHRKDIMSGNTQFQTSVQLFTRHTIHLETESRMAYG